MMYEPGGNLPRPIGLRAGGRQRQSRLVVMFEERNEKARAKQRSAEDWCSSPEIRTLLAGIAGRPGLSPTDADDVLQETLIALLRAGPDVHVCRIWILKVAARKAIDIVRSTAAMANREDCYTRSRASAEETPELRYLLRARAGQLPPRLRLLYELQYVQGLT